MRVRGRVKLTPELRALLQRWSGWELEVASNGHCLFLAIIEGLRLVGRTALDVRRAVGAWMLRHRGAVLAGGMTVAGTMRAEHGMGVEA